MSHRLIFLALITFSVEVTWSRQFFDEPGAHQKMPNPVAPIEIVGNDTEDASSPKRTPAAAVPLASVEGVFDFDESFLKLEPIISWAVDPFEKIPGYAFKVPQPKVPSLQAVFFGNGERSALINGEEYEVGDEVDDFFSVAEIGKNYVLLENGASLVELVIPPGRASESYISVQPHQGRSR